VAWRIELRQHESERGNMSAMISYLTATNRTAKPSGSMALDASPKPCYSSLMGQPPELSDPGNRVTVNRFGTMRPRGPTCAACTPKFIF
jgi:hypothetical protein